MIVKELRSIFQRLEELLSSAGSRQSARDVNSVVKALDGSEDKTVDQFVSETKRLLDPQPPQIEGAAIPDKFTTTHYVCALLSAGNHREAFEEVLEDLRADKRVSKDELFAIANAFFNEPTGGTYVFKFKSKGAAYEFIRKKFVERAQLDNKFKIIEKLTHSR